MSHRADESYSSDEKPPAPCKACHAFSDWVKIQGGKSNGRKAKKDHDVGHECPLDKIELGRSTWSFLHSMAAYYPEKPSSADRSEVCGFFKLFGRFYPCEHCAEEFRNDIKESPPQAQSNKSLSEWLCQIHNRVNVRLGKEEFDCSRVLERWRDGWKDGSCEP